MNDLTKKYPRFQYNLSSPNAKNYCCITAGDEAIHRIANVEEFYKALGFTDAMHGKKIEQEVFVWTEYHKDGGILKDADLQIKLIEYLNEHCAGFREKYST